MVDDIFLLFAYGRREFHDSNGDFTYSTSIWVGKLRGAISLEACSLFHNPHPAGPIIADSFLLSPLSFFQRQTQGIKDDP